MNYNYGSTAYEYEYQQQEEVQNQLREEKRRAARQLKKKNKTTRRIVSYILVAGLAAGFLVSKNVAVSDTGKEIESLQAELAAQQTYTSEKTFELEQKIGLTTIEETAMTKLGMQRPDKTQVIYVDIKKDDYTERTVKEVEGLKNNLTQSLKKAKQTIINIFTLN